MKKNELDAFIHKNADKPFKWLVEHSGYSERTIRVKFRELGYPPRVGKGNQPKNIEDSFLKFLQKGRTKEEIQDAFGKKTNELLNGYYKGYTLFNQRDEYNRKLFILLPVSPEPAKIKDKDWKYSNQIDEFGLPEPYLVVQLPSFKGTLTIAPLFDVHYGHFAHKNTKFQSYIRWIAETKNVYAILGGDMFENAIDDGRGMSYDQAHNPESQLEYMKKALAPIAHKCLVSVPGNHEERTYKKTGIDVARILADSLQIPYFAGPVLLDILANDQRWTLYIHHGRGNSQTKGGKMNAANRPKTFTSMVHFFVSGHVHDRVCESETILYPNPLTCRLEQKEQWTVIAPSFLGWNGTYAYKAEYKPPAKGGVSIELRDDGGYRAIQT